MHKLAETLVKRHEVIVSADPDAQIAVDDSVRKGFLERPCDKPPLGVVDDDPRDASADAMPFPVRLV